MNVAEALPLVTFTSRPVKYTIEPAGSVRPESPYCGAPSTTALIQTASVTRTPTTIGRAWIAGDAADAGAAVAVDDGGDALVRRHLAPRIPGECPGEEDESRSGDSRRGEDEARLLDRFAEPES